MRRWKGYAAGLLLLAGLTPSVHAQVAGIPGGSTAATTTTTAVDGATSTTTTTTAAGGAAGAGNLWSYLCLTDAQKLRCKACLCSLPIVQLLGNATAGLSAMTGGVLGSTCCPGPYAATLADLAMPADSIAGAAGRVKLDEAEAAKRRADVRYLSTADCHRWPEVEAALINALRLDRNECVRWEAAMAFQRGCCCTKPVIRALTLTVSGSEDDGAPAETSERVKAAAHAALDHCLACYVEIEPVPPAVNGDKGKEGPQPREGSSVSRPGMSKGFSGNSATAPTKMTPAEYYRRVELLTREQVVAEAKRVREHLAPVSGTATVAIPTGQQSVFGLVQSAMAPKAVGPSTPPPPQSAPVQNAQPQSVQEAPKKSSGGLLALFGFKGSAPVKESGERVVSTGTPTTTIVPATPPTTPPATTAIPALAPTTTPAVTPIPSVTSARPTGTPVVATSYAPQKQSRVQPPVVAPAASPTQPPVVAPAVSAAATPVPQASILPQPEKLLIILRDAARPEHRAWAADVLGSFDGWTNPKVVAGLVAAARDDKAATVRLICARNLGRMNVRTMAVLSAVQALKSDADAAVRAEAEKALHLLNNEPVASLSPRPSGR